MKKWILITSAVLLVFTGIFIDRFITRFQQAAAWDLQSVSALTAGSERGPIPASAVGATGDLILAQANQKNANKPDTWVVKIENNTITLDEFEREWSVHVYSLPFDETQKKKYEDDAMNKKKFLTNLINEHLVYRKALQEGYEKRKDVQDIIKAVGRRAVIQVYLNEKLEPKLSEPTDDQVEVIYNQNKKLFANMDIDVARQQIKLQLLQRQYNDLLDELIERLKGETRVLRNDEVKM